MHSLYASFITASLNGLDVHPVYEQVNVWLQGGCVVGWDA